MKSQENSNEKLNYLIYGKDKTKQITSIEVNNGFVRVHKSDGSVLASRHEYYMLWARQLTDSHYELEGEQDYKYFTKRETKMEWLRDVRWAKKHNHETSVIWNDVEQYMVRNGITYYKGMGVDDLNVLSFDIETTGLKHNSDSKVLLITNTYKSSTGDILNKTFAYDDYRTESDMINEWCKFVVALDPHIITGHNILGYDLPYLTYCFAGDLPLGKRHAKSSIEKYTRQFRKDGSQSYPYNNIDIPGREIVDTWYLSIKYDVLRKYPSYRLKEIIKYEGLEQENRQHYDAATIGQNYKIPKEWEKIKNYAETDANDSYNLFLLMCPAYFYYAQSVSKSFQEIVLGATGSQINNIMTRSYLQLGHSIPKASRTEYFQGGTSFGNPGIYNHVCKVDVASMYPSIILDKGLYDRGKDPEANLKVLTQYFTTQRLHNKKLHKKTGERRYLEMSNAQKIVINSIYGFLGCPGLSFNSPTIAATVTETGREYLNRGIEWSNDKGYSIVNADTDSFTFTTSKRMDADEFKENITDLNSLFPNAISWENDGQFKCVVVVKAKNYAMEDYDGNVVIKGSGLKGTMKEPALREYMTTILENLLHNSTENLVQLYNKYANEIKNLDNIGRWVAKKTITEKVLNPTRTNESRIIDAIKDRLEAGNLIEGDKVNVFFKEQTVLELEEGFDGTYHHDTLYNKLFVTTKIFSNILDVKEYPNYKLKRNKELLEELNG